MIAFYMILCYSCIMEIKNHLKIRFEGEKFNFHHTLEHEPTLRTYYRHNHPSYELYVFFEGEVHFVVEDKTYTVQPNTALLICPLAYHYAKTLRSNVPYHRCAIDFDKSLVMPALQDFLPNSTLVFPWDPNLFMGDLALVEKAIENGTEEEITLACSLFVNKMLLHFKQENVAMQTEGAFNTTNQTVQEILQFINAHIYEPLHIKDIADNLFLSSVYVSQLFSDNMKISIMDYIKQKKILLAQDLIANGTKPTLAAQELGFEEYSTFFRLYKKYLGCSPSAHTPQ